ncbi:hypothetical protein BJF82_14655 [Kytococcus sp. CUA-901]|nr:hypothetical protein BJF82_14655 [Kytococcus sp. CUA-901]
MTFLVDAYAEDEAPNTKGGVDKRTVLRLDPRLAPVKVAVLPLSRNADLTPKAKDLASRLRQHWMVDVDDAGAIGKRYRRQDEIGTPYCVTVDFDTLEDPGGHHPRPGLDGPGACLPGPGRVLPRAAADRLLSPGARGVRARSSRAEATCGHTCCVMTPWDWFLAGD